MGVTHHRQKKVVKFVFLCFAGYGITRREQLSIPLTITMHLTRVFQSSVYLTSWMTVFCSLLQVSSFFLSQLVNWQNACIMAANFFPYNNPTLMLSVGQHPKAMDITG